MKAIVCNEFAPLDRLVYTDVPDPIGGPKDVVVKIHAAGVNYPDALLVQGLYQARPPLPFTPGNEFAGEILSVGDEVRGLAPGMRVAGFNPGLGAFAEQIACPAAVVAPIPDAMPYVDAANLTLAHGTAHYALKQRGKLEAGETLLVLGAAGGTGIAAVQIGKHMGARVIAACSTPEKLAVAKANGADELINYSEQDLKGAIKELTGGRGVDVAYDPVGGDAFDATSRAMAPGGRLLVIGFASGTIPSLPVNLTLVKEYSLVGVFWGAWVTRDPKAFAANMGELHSWYAEGKVRLVTDAEVPLANAAAGLGRLMNREVTGKLVLVP